MKRKTVEGAQTDGLLICKGNGISNPLKKKDDSMSKKHPECPVYNHNNCREVHNPKLCALVKADKICLRKKRNLKDKSKKKDSNELEELTVPDGIIGNF